jgi:hypothetical protein
MLKWGGTQNRSQPFPSQQSRMIATPGEIGQGQEANIGQKLSTIRGKVKGNGRQRRRGDAECRRMHRTQLKLQQETTAIRLVAFFTGINPYRHNGLSTRQRWFSYPHIPPRRM